ncbi:MAG: hypothetical protein IT463_07050 [Planctomycetes bacterium]|nr:hypothetical protein [Planctomycetota bacterium]
MSSISPGLLPDAAAGQAYVQPLAYSGTYDTEPTLVWSVASGALPPSVALSFSGASAQLAGSPTATGDFAFTLRVAFGTFQHEQPFTLRVAATAPLVITMLSLPGSAVGTAYGQNLYATGGSGTGYTWSLAAGTLPTGLLLDGKNTVLSWGSFTLAGNLDQSLGGGRLGEVSGICASRNQPGVFWVHDDSGAGPEFYAVNAAGAVLQRYQLSTTAQDWEDIALGPGPGGDCLFIGDVGDNSAVRSNCRVLRVPEPVVPATPGSAITAAHEEFWFTYPGGPQNCETLLVDPATGTPYLVEKTAAAPRVHRFPMPLSTGWTSGSPVALVQVTAGGTFDGTLTGGDASRDGQRLILRGYSTAREYARPAGGSFDDLFAQTGSAVTITGGQQYEAVCYSHDGRRLFTCTELAAQATAPIYAADAAGDSGSTTISGTPGAAGTYLFTVRVSDSAGNTATRDFSIVVQ